MGGVTSSSTRRKTNIELLRIISMLLIICAHYVNNSGLMDVCGPILTDPLSWRSVYLLIIGAWGKTSINCFVLITGYFMCQSHITARKFAKLFFEVLFYRIVINTVFWGSGYKQFTFIEFIKTLVPIKSVSTGFTNAFLLFYLIIPFLSILVQHLNEKQHLTLILWCGFTYVFLGTVPGFSVTMNYVSWFSVLFVIASYIQLYPKKIFGKMKVWVWLTICFVSFSIISVVGCIWLGAKSNSNIAYIFVTDSNTFLAVATGVCAFMLFKNMNVSYSKLINSVSASTFGVLLIHANSDTMRQWLWKDILNVVGHYNSSLMPLHAIASVLAIFIICTIIDQLRIRIIEKPFFKLWDKHWDSVLKTYKQIETRIASKLGIQE